MAVYNTGSLLVPRSLPVANEEGSQTRTYRFNNQNPREQHSPMGDQIHECFWQNLALYGINSLKPM